MLTNLYKPFGLAFIWLANLKHKTAIINSSELSDNTLEQLGKFLALAPYDEPIELTDAIVEELASTRHQLDLTKQPLEIQQAFTTCTEDLKIDINKEEKPFPKVIFSKVFNATFINLKSKLNKANSDFVIVKNKEEYLTVVRDEYTTIFSRLLKVIGTPSEKPNLGPFRNPLGVCLFMLIKSFNEEKPIPGHLIKLFTAKKHDDKDIKCFKVIKQVLPKSSYNLLDQHVKTFDSVHESLNEKQFLYAISVWAIQYHLSTISNAVTPASSTVPSTTTPQTSSPPASQPMEMELSQLSLAENFSREEQKSTPAETTDLREPQLSGFFNRPTEKPPSLTPMEVARSQLSFVLQQSQLSVFFNRPSPNTPSLPKEPSKKTDLNFH